MFKRNFCNPLTSNLEEFTWRAQTPKFIWLFYSIDDKCKKIILLPKNDWEWRRRRICAVQRQIKQTVQQKPLEFGQWISLWTNIDITEPAMQKFGSTQCQRTEFYRVSKCRTESTITSVQSKTSQTIHSVIELESAHVMNDCIACFDQAIHSEYVHMYTLCPDESAPPSYNKLSHKENLSKFNKKHWILTSTYFDHFC